MNDQAIEHEIPGQQHSVPCLYEYALARLNLQDRDDLRVLFWDAHYALEWNDGTDAYIVPSRDSSCPACDQARAAAEQ